jgi:hypothetical protein
VTADELAELERYLSPAERKELCALLDADIAERPWTPLPGPQTTAYESVADVVGFGGAAGGGKGLALDTPLPTPSGWVNMGDVQVGDTLFDDRGQPCAVTAVSEINRRPCFRLTFDDGSALVADDVHRWVTFNAAELAALTRKSPEWRAARRAARPSRAKEGTSPARLAALAKLNARDTSTAPPVGAVRSTSELHATLLTSSGRRNHAIPVASNLATPTSDLPIPPYTLGAWLGDGSSRNGQLTGMDAGIWERIEADGFKVVHYASSEQAHSILGLKVKLRAAGLLQNKHIPPAYLRAAHTDRVALLQGLMDTDGHAALDGGCEFDWVNEVLVGNVLELVRSLGIKATLTTGVAKLDGRVISAKWRVKFVTNLPVFGLQRKQDRIRPTQRRVAAFRYLVACEPVDSVPTRCIAVDSASRQYLAGTAMVPTHNTDLACGKAISQHQVVQIFRREGTELNAIIDRLEGIVGHREGLGGKPPVWRSPAGNCRLIEFCSVPNLGDERKFQGRAKDLLVVDEAANFLEAQVRFLMGWVRTTDPEQRTQTLLTFNPPTSADGRWVIQFFAPWLDPKWAGVRAVPGELRYVAVVNGEDMWVDDERPFVMAGKARKYDFDPADYTGARATMVIRPQSRTFIPSRITDNPFLVGTNYMSTLQSLPEPLRSQMLNGDFMAGVKDDEWQVIPTRWVEAAQARWKPKAPKGEMVQMGVDVARGGDDSTTVATRHLDPQAGHDQWYDEIKSVQGADTDDGDKAASHVLIKRRDDAPINIDVIGVGASAYDSLKRAEAQVMGVNVAIPARRANDKSGSLTFFNLRSDLWWGFRELLDPTNDTGIALPPDPKLLAELCAPRFTLSGKAIKVESREDIVKRLGYSPDRATAVILASIDQPKVAAMRAARSQRDVLDYDPYA